MRDMKAAALLNNVAEDKRSNEVEDNDDDDEMDPQTIDKLIEISSKLHLPADDVVEIISDVQEKKKKRKDLPPSNTPRFRPLVPLKAKPRPQAYQYPKSLKKSSYTVDPYKKWYKEKNKGKLSKQDYWFKPQKQFLAYPSFPYYQKPYRAYYPVFFPPPKRGSIQIPLCRLTTTLGAQWGTVWSLQAVGTETGLRPGTGNGHKPRNAPRAPTHNRTVSYLITFSPIPELTRLSLCPNHVLLRAGEHLLTSTHQTMCTMSRSLPRRAMKNWRTSLRRFITTVGLF